MLKNKSIFIVDDDVLWASLLKFIMTSLGYTNITVFHSGEQCLENLHLNPKLVFLDYQLEEMDGMDVLSKLQDRNPDIAVVFCTGQEDLHLAINAMKSGSSDFLLKKNITKKVIAGIIEDLVEKQVFADKVM